jgi:Kef-type K+ transport system membrane component KefB
MSNVHLSYPREDWVVPPAPVRGDEKACQDRVHKLLLRLPASWKIVAFTVNLILGLTASQTLGAVVDKDTYHTWEQIVQALTMWALSFIMINVGYEFTVDKGNLTEYGWDYLIAMTAAGFPWMFVAAWFMFGIGGLAVDEAFLIARFAAPTSAGILFSMLEGAGLKETWLFSKARILAIFDDLDTILLMIPLKVFMVGFKWELVVVVFLMASLLAVGWIFLHRISLPHGWHWSLFYAAVVSALCKILHHYTHHSPDMEPIHIEVLLPAFVIGCIIDTPGARHELQLQRQNSEIRRSKSNLSITESSNTAEIVMNVTRSKQTSESIFEPTSLVPAPELAPAALEVAPSPEEAPAFVQEDELEDSRPTQPAAWVTDDAKPHVEEHKESPMDQHVQTVVSLVFMVLVGLSMPLLIGPNAENSSDLSPGELIYHITVVSLLMILGKMFPIFCYRDEADLKARLALCLGMCPRGEVGASIIVISLELGITGPGVLVAMGSLAVNLVLSGAFIASVKYLLRGTHKEQEPTIITLWV